MKNNNKIILKKLCGVVLPLLTAFIKANPLNIRRDASAKPWRWPQRATRIEVYNCRILGNQDTLSTSKDGRNFYKL
jgi:hypothetical protein